MNFVWHTALKDLKGHLRNPVQFALWIGIPLVVGLLAILAMGGSGGPSPQAHLLVVDRDDSFVSGLMIGALSQDTVGDFIRAENITYDEGRQRIDAGEASALLIIPEGFGDAVLLDKPAVLELVTNPSQRILPLMVSEGLSMFVDANFYLHRLVGDELRAIAAGPGSGNFTFSDTFMSDFTVRINSVMRGLGQYLDPLVITMEDAPRPVTEEEEQEGPGAGVIFLPTLLFMGLMFMAQGLGDEFWHEHQQRTLMRVIVSPSGIPAFLLGKTLASWLLIFLVAVLGLGLGFIYLKISIRLFLPAVIWTTFSGLLLAMVMTTIHLFAGSQRAGNIVTMAVMFPLMMIGGSFFPIEMMPGWMATIAGYTPNGWAVTHLGEILKSEIDLVGLLPSGLILMVLLGLLFAITAWRLKARVV